MDECTAGTHQCDRNAICINTTNPYTCKCTNGMEGNGYLCGDLVKLKDSPKTVRTRSGLAVQLACSYYNRTNRLHFHWIKDNAVLDLAKYKVRKTISNDGAGVDITTHRLDFNATDVTYQGYYWCRIGKEGFTEQTSKKALVRLTDASATRIAMKIKQGYSNKLNNRTSAEHAKLHTTLSKMIFDYVIQKNKSLSRVRRNTQATDQAVLLTNIRRDGTATRLDAIVYYGKVTKQKRLQICSAMRNLSVSSFPSIDPEILELQRSSYDCCYSNSTGHPEIKGIIQWPTTAITETAKEKCPVTNKKENATRHCTSRDFDEEPLWQTENTEKCMYIREATQKLDTLTKTVVNATNAVTIVKELEEVTKNQTNIKTYVDVALAVDVIANVAQSQSNNTGAFDGIVNVTNSLMDAGKDLVENAQEKNNASAKLVKAIETFAENIPLPENKTQQVFSKPNLAIGIAEVSKDESSLEQTGFIISGSIDKSRTSIEMGKEGDKTGAAKVADIVLPGPLFKEARRKKGSSDTGLRVTTFLYDNEKLFLSKQMIGPNVTKKVNSKVLAVSIKGMKLENLKEDQRVRSEFKELENREEKHKLSCVYWEEEQRAWSTRGCRYDGTNPRSISNHKCSCNHLTNFALLLDVTKEKSSVRPPPIVKEFLQFFTYIGCGISIVGLSLTVFTLLWFKDLQKKSPQKIMIGICSSLVMALIVFLVGTQYTERFISDQGTLTPNSPAVCLVSSILTHLFVLMAFCWMGMQSYFLYLSCVKVMAARNSQIVKKMALLAIGSPLVIVAIVVGIDAKKIVAYTKQSSVTVNSTHKILKEGNFYVKVVDDSNRVCMINGIAFYAAYLAPIGLILLINFVFLFLSMRGILSSSKKTNSKSMSMQRKWRMVAACTFLLGLTWILGIFAIGPLKVPLQIAFTVFNSLQGMFIFIFYCICNPKVKKEWRKCIYGEPKEVSSSSQSSRKTGSTSMSKSERRDRKKSRSERPSRESGLHMHTYLDSLASLKIEFTDDQYRKESVFTSKKGFYGIVGSEGDDSLTEPRLESYNSAST